MAFKKEYKIISVDETDAINKILSELKEDIGESIMYLPIAQVKSKVFKDDLVLIQPIVLTKWAPLKSNT